MHASSHILVCRYFANFAATGNPGTANPAMPAPAWPVYEAKTRSTLSIDVASAGGITTHTAIRSTFCEFWDTKVGYDIY